MQIFQIGHINLLFFTQKTDFHIVLSIHYFVIEIWQFELKKKGYSILSSGKWTNILAKQELMDIIKYMGQVQYLQTVLFISLADINLWHKPCTYLFMLKSVTGTYQYIYSQTVFKDHPWCS